MKILKYTLTIITLLVIIYFAGPRYPIPQLDNTPLANDISDIAAYVDSVESSTPNIKPNNQTEIVWANDSLRNQTEYVIIYLPGFGASKGEGEPIHRQVAQKYGCNLLLYRPVMYGITEEEPLKDLTPEVMNRSAKEGIRMAKALGKKVIVMCCSTGATAAFYLAAADKDIAAVIAYSPNIDFDDSNSDLLIGPWGHQLARLIFDGDYREFEATDTIKAWWINRYRLEALLALKAYVKATMTPETFQAISQPVFMGYYYKDEENKDNIVSVPKMRTTFEQLGTPDNLKKQVAFANVGGHVIASKYYSDDLESVYRETCIYIEEALQLKPE